MSRKRKKIEHVPEKKPPQIRFLTDKQEHAWEVMERSTITFLIGPAGTAKTHLATAYAVSRVLSKRAERFVLTRPVVEAGEKLGFLPGEFSDKIRPYLIPVIDATERILGRQSSDRAEIERATEIAPLAFLRGRTLYDASCLLDEAQNVTASQMRMYLTRLGSNSKMLITGDPYQSDIGRSPLMRVVDSLRGVPGVGVVEFGEEDIVRHPVLGPVLDAIKHVD